MMRPSWIMLACLLLAAAPPALAADAVPPSEPATLRAPAEGDDPGNCQFITNDCEVCTIDAAGKPSCSSQGIACTPTRRWCLIPKQ